jgi:predicted TIM-barrel fold metal-dependent hydrolase
MTAPRCPIYDSHAHLVADDDMRYPRSGFRAGKPRPKRAQLPPFGPGTVGIPGGMHGPTPVNEKPTAEQMNQWMLEEGVVGLAAVQKGMIYGTDNSYIMDAAERYPDQMRAVIIVDPLEEKTLPLMREGARRGIAGIRFFPVDVEDKAAWLTSSEALAVWRLADELGLVVDIEGPKEDWWPMLLAISDIADLFPDLRIVLDHVYLPVLPIANEVGFSIDACFDDLAAHDNITYKFTCLNMDVIREQGARPHEILSRLVGFYGADKLMWGSDIGTSSGTYSEMVSRAIDSTKLLTEEQRRKVLHDTGRRVFTGWTG